MGGARQRLGSAKLRGVAGEGPSRSSTRSAERVDSRSNSVSTFSLLFGMQKCRRPRARASDRHSRHSPGHPPPARTLGRRGGDRNTTRTSLAFGRVLCNRCVCRKCRAPTSWVRHARSNPPPLWRVFLCPETGHDPLGLSCPHHPDHSVPAVGLGEAVHRAQVLAAPTMSRAGLSSRLLMTKGRR